MNNDVLAFYDATALRTAEEWYSNEILKSTIDDFLSLLPPSPSVLDLGCGPGHESKRLARAGARVTGLDFSEACIDIARERCPECAFVQRDIRDPGLVLKSFDGIFACASLIHLSPSELPEVLTGVHALLKPSGCLATIIQDGEGVHEKYSRLEFEGRKYNRILYLYTREAIIEAARRTGFVFVREGFLDMSLREQGWRNYIFSRC
jgi:trans-aconitate methyltransferase